MDKHHNHRIASDHGAEMIRKHQEHAPKGAILAHTFNKSAFLSLLAHPEAEGIRLYHAVNKEGQPTLVAAAVREDGTAIDDQMMDTSFPCPPFCKPPYVPTVPDPEV